MHIIHGSCIAVLKKLTSADPEMVILYLEINWPPVEIMTFQKVTQQNKKRKPQM